MPLQARPESPVKFQQGPQQLVNDFVVDLNKAFINIYNHDKEEFAGRTYRARRLRRFRRETKKSWLLSGIHSAIKKAISVDMEDVKLWKDVVKVVEDAESLVMLTRYKNKPPINLNLKHSYYVYVDGACTNNGRANPQAGIGVYFGPDHPWNVSEPLESWDKPTNNVAELRAAIKAIQIVKEEGGKRLEIRTDSEYVKKGFETWMLNWLTNGWLNYHGDPVENKAVWRKLLREQKEIDLGWVWIKGHSRDKGNTMADKLAREGAKRFVHSA